MAGNSGRIKATEAKRLRKEAGKYIRRRRVELDMTQKNLADTLGLEFYTFISSVETGANQVPPESVDDWADALKMDRREFATHLLSYYSPGYYRAIFGGGTGTTKKDPEPVKH
ncbi:helix-turn-helix transcriptional regulator [Hoeflea sp. YIM 152468]|uniref:helix-turn-helix domain-containing protein n=1 Tax=Hoeflea sp. YIM 152468 TaxID=3031759 RepID=UPI0023DCCE69|nr:helix-turn-helix transcriptional regulator [Hoeflea sp. YIM 152468]MDF1610003.1 helix-turn-helix transcriptional regulator [Hoeflea sp. YIM 152468]